MLQIRGRRLGVVLAPELYMIGLACDGAIESDQSGAQHLKLGLDQGESCAPRTLKQGKFELELDPDVADMGYRLVEPTMETASSVRGGAEDNSLRPGVTRLGVHGCGQLGLDQAIECPINQRTTHGEDSTQGGVRPEVLRYGEPVLGALRQKTKHCVFGERESGLSHLRPKG